MVNDKLLIIFPQKYIFFTKIKNKILKLQKNKLFLQKFLNKKQKGNNDLRKKNIILII